MDTEEYLARCMAYIDLNMVRAGVVKHHAGWDTCGYREIQAPLPRYGVIDQRKLMDLFCVMKFETYQKLNHSWVEDALGAEEQQRDDIWTESLAAGSIGFIQSIKNKLGMKVRYRDIANSGNIHALQEPMMTYSSYDDGE